MKLNSFQRAVLCTVRKLGKDACGFKIREALDQKLYPNFNPASGRGRGLLWFIFCYRGVSIGKLYATLELLEEENLVVSYQMPSGPERSFRPRTHWYLTREALQVLAVK